METCNYWKSSRSRQVIPLVMLKTPESKLIGKSGKIKSIDGARFISVENRLFKYQSEKRDELVLGESYIVKDILNGTVFI